MRRRGCGCTTCTAPLIWELAALNLEPDEWARPHRVRCRPPVGRTPKHDEIGTCQSWLDQTIRTLQPPVILAVGEGVSRIPCRDHLAPEPFIPEVERITDQTQPHGSTAPSRYLGCLVVPMLCTSGLTWLRYYLGTFGLCPVCELGRDALQLAAELHHHPI